MRVEEGAIVFNVMAYLFAPAQCSGGAAERGVGVGSQEKSQLTPRILVFDRMCVFLLLFHSQIVFWGKDHFS